MRRLVLLPLCGALVLAATGPTAVPAPPDRPDPAASGSASPRTAFSEGAWTFWIGSVLQGDRKFILVTPQDRMLFDLASDPGETKNLALEDGGRDSVRCAC